MHRIQASAVLILIFFVAAGFGEEAAKSSSIPKAISVSVSTLDLSGLQKEVLSAYDTGNYSRAALLLQEMKSRYTENYRLLPYELLHAKALYLAGDLENSFTLYQEVSSDTRFSAYSLLPLARIAAQRGKSEAAISYYQQYLSNGKNPDYYGAALDACNYAFSLNSAEALQTLAVEVQYNLPTKRTGQYYLAKSYLLKNEKEKARALFQELIQKGIKDDVTFNSLTELDLLDGDQLSREEQLSRGRLAYQFWNFELARKYLEPYALDDIQYAYFYGRVLFFLGDIKDARSIFQQAIEKWPQDPMTKLCLYQYANICARDGDFKKAQSLYEDLLSQTTGKDRESATYKLVQNLRAQCRLQEALVALQPLCYSRTTPERTPSIFLRGRIYYQERRYLEALVDFDHLLNTRSTLNKKELLFWKAMTAEKLDRRSQANQIFSLLSTGEDFFAILAQEKLATSSNKGDSRARIPQSSYEHICGLPDQTKEAAVIERMAAGDVLPALLYLHLYEEASKNTGSISAETWNLMGIDSKDRYRKYMELAHLAVLGKNYQTASYYSDILQKSFLKNVSLFSLPEDVLMILFPYPFRESVEPLSKQRGLDPYYVVSIMKQESQFKRFAKSPMFARGLMQLIPPTADSMAELLGISGFSPDQLYHPEVNINLGTKYLEEMVKQFGTRPEIIAASYNSGESNVRRWLACTSSDEVMEFFSNIDLAETKDYVVQVKTTYEWYRRIYAKSQNNELTQKTNAAQ